MQKIEVRWFRRSDQPLKEEVEAVGAPNNFFKIKMTPYIKILQIKLIPFEQRTISENFRQIGHNFFFGWQYWVRELKWLECLSVLPVHCHSCLHVICLCSTVAEGSTDQLLKFQLSSVKTKVSKTTFKNGCQYRAHPVQYVVTNKK